MIYRRVEEYKGFEIRCLSKSNVLGFKHLGRIFKNNKFIKTFDIQYYNRTWEAFPFETIINKCKSFIDLILS